MNDVLKDAVGYFDSIGVKIIEASFDCGVLHIRRHEGAFDSQTLREHVERIKREERGDEDDEYVTGYEDYAENISISLELLYGNGEDNRPVIVLRANLNHRDGERFSSARRVAQEPAVYGVRPSYMTPVTAD